MIVYRGSKMLALVAIAIVWSLVGGQESVFRKFNFTSVAKELSVSELQYPFKQASECIYDERQDILTCVENYPYHNVTSVWRNSPGEILYVSVNCLTRGEYRRNTCVCKNNSSNPENKLAEDKYYPCQLNDLDEGILRSLTNLEVLDLSFNTIQTVSARALIGLKKLKYLSLSHNKIKTIPMGFLCLVPNLQFLGLSELSLELFPLKKCKDNFTSLTTVDLRASNLTEIPDDAFDNLPAIKALDLSFNRLKEIRKSAFSGSRALQYLNFGHCNISSIFPHFCDYQPDVINILLNNNSFTAFDFTTLEGCLALTVLDLSSNAIESVTGNISKLEFLHGLNLAFNKLSSLDIVFDGPSNLTTLYLSNNKLQNFSDDHFIGLQNLVILDLSFNNLRDSSGFGQLFRNLSGLPHLNLQNNRIERLVNGSFAGLKNLQHLLLSHNLIQDLDSQSFQGLNKLTILSLDNNLLSTLPDDIFVPITTDRDPAVPFDSLYLSNNKFTDLGNVRKWPVMKHLEIVNTSLTSFPSAIDLITMETLNVSQNRLSKFFGAGENIFANFESLKYLDISRNLINDFDMTKLQTMINVNTVNMAENKINIEISSQLFEGMKNLSSLNLAVNQIKSFVSLFSESSLQNLGVLNMSQNPITSLGNISDNSANSVLETIDFSSCNISKISSAAFYGLTNLRLVNLEGNNIETFPPFYANPETTYLLKDNPIVCACNMSWLGERTVKVENGTSIAVQNFKLPKCTVYTESVTYNPSDLERRQFLCPEAESCDSQCACFKAEQNGDIKIVKCRNNLQSVPVIIASSTLLLFLDGNSFTQDTSLSAFLNLETMETKELYLNRSSISSINASHFVSFEALEILVLSHNLLKTLPSNVFQAQKLLKQLYLNDNQLSAVEPDVFDALYSLQELDLSGNNLVHLASETVAELQNLDYVKYYFLARNRWACDCSNLQFKDFIDDVIFKIRDRALLVCGQDATRRIRYISRSAFVCSKELDTSAQKRTMIIVALVAICLLVLLLAVFIYFRRELLSLLYYYTGCHIPRKTICPSAQFDAYLSFEPTDQHCASYVQNTLKPKLHNNSYTVQTSEDTIQDLEVIKKLIEDSRCSIFIVDKNFSANSFLINVFLCAIDRRKIEKRHNVILIIHGDINLENLEPELLSRLRKGDYITARSRLWWQRLVYELPEPTSGFRHNADSDDEDVIAFSTLAEDQGQYEQF